MTIMSQWTTHTTAASFPVILEPTVANDMGSLDRDDDDVQEDMEALWLRPSAQLPHLNPQDSVPLVTSRYDTMKSIPRIAAGQGQILVRSRTNLNLHPHKQSCVEVKFPNVDAPQGYKAQGQQKTAIQNHLPAPVQQAAPDGAQVQADMTGGHQHRGYRSTVDINRSYMQHYKTVQQRRAACRPRYQPTRQSWPPPASKAAVNAYLAPVPNTTQTGVMGNSGMLEQPDTSSRPVQYVYKRRIPDHVENVVVTPKYKLNYTKSWLAAEGERCINEPGVLGGQDDESSAVNQSRTLDAQNGGSSGLQNGGSSSKSPPGDVATVNKPISHADSSDRVTARHDADALHLNSIADYPPSEVISSSLSSASHQLPAMRRRPLKMPEPVLPIKQTFGERLQAFLEQYGNHGNQQHGRYHVRKRGEAKMRDARKLGIVSSHRLGQLLNNNLPLTLNNFYTAGHK